MNAGRRRALEAFADLRSEIFRDRPRAEMFDLSCASLVDLASATFAAVALPAGDALRVVGYATSEGVRSPPNRLLEVAFPWGGPIAEGGLLRYRRNDFEDVEGLAPLLRNLGDLLVAAVHTDLAAPGEQRSVGGLLFVGRGRDDAPFGRADGDAVSFVADEIALALSLARLRRTRRLLELARERDRTGRAFNDEVIQRLFALGARLQVALAEPVALAGRARESVGEIDTLISSVRDTILDSAAPALDTASRLSVIVETHDVGDEVDVDVMFSGDLDAVPAALVDSLIAVLREGLNNVAEHASASQAEVTVAVDDLVTVIVADNGTGIDPAAPKGGGLSTLAARAEVCGGHLSVDRRVDGGTMVRWSVPFVGGAALALQRRADDGYSREV